MAVSGDSQALIASFIFGVIVFTDCGLLYLCVQTHGRSIYQIWARLVLAIFLASSTVWAVFGFVATLVNDNSPSSCQAVIATAATFDQLARVALAQFLIGVLRKGNTISFSNVSCQALIVLRFVVGGVFVGVQRPQFKPVCVASNLLLALGIATLALDVLIVLVALARVLSISRLTNATKIEVSSDRGGTLLLFTLSFLIWAAMSTPSTLGVVSFSFAIRTVVPAIGLLVVLVTTFLIREKLFALEVFLSISRESTPEVPWSPRHITAEDVRKKPARKNPRLALTKPPEPPRVDAGFSAHMLPIHQRQGTGQANAILRGASLPFPVRAQTAPLPTHTGQNGHSRQTTKLSISRPVMRESTARNLREKMTLIDLATAANKANSMRAGRAIAALTTPEASEIFQQDGVQQVQDWKDFHRPNYTKPRASSKPLSNKHSPQVTQVNAQSIRPLRSSSVAKSAYWNADRYGNETGTPSSIEPITDMKTPQRPHISSAMSPPSVATNTAPLVNFTMTSQSAPPDIPAQNPKRKTYSSISSPDTERVKTSIMPTDQFLASPPSRGFSGKHYIASVSPQALDGISPLVPRVHPLSYDSPRQRTFDDIVRYGQRILSQKHTSKMQQDNSRWDEFNFSDLAHSSISTQEASAGIGDVSTNPPRSLARMKKEKMALEDHCGYDRVNIAFEDHNFAALEKGDLGPSRHDSIMHRPRPIPRISAIHRADYVSKLHSAVYFHRRSRSGGNLDTSQHNRNTKSEDASDTQSAAQSARAVLPRRSVADFPMVSPVAPNPKAVGSKSSGLAAKNMVQRGQLQSATAMRIARPQEVAVSPTVSLTTTGGKSLFPASDKLSPSPESRRRFSPAVQNEAAENLPTQTANSQIQTSPHRQSGSYSGNMQDWQAKTFVPLLSEVETTDEHQQLDVRAAVGTASKDCKEGVSTSQLSQPAWQDRLGERPPTFSIREGRANFPRKLPPPTPLLLSNFQRSVTTETYSPSPESPDHALNNIRKQLEHLQVRDAGEATLSAREQEKITLLENLETEMDLHQSHWARIREDLARRSQSSQRSSLSSTKATAHADVYVHSQQITPTSDYDMTSTGFSPTHLEPSSVVTHENLSEVEQTQSTNLPGSQANVSAEASRRIGPFSSPTPPGTDESGDDRDDRANIYFSLVERAEPDLANPTILVYKPPSVSTAITQSSVIDDVILETSPTSPDISLDLEARAVFETQRTSQHQTNSPSGADFYRDSTTPYSTGEVLQPRKLVSRPVIMRRTRKSKRISELADIPESPKPLENKRDTLGFFKLPWGETSDMATLRPPQSFAPYSCASSIYPTGFIQSPPLGPQSYPISFFDHYDDDHDEASGDDDDSFDDETLWEIASLLKSDRLPSRPWNAGQRSPDPKDYDWNSEKDLSSTTSTRESFDELPLKSSLTLLPPEDSLWVRKSSDAQTSENLGVAQPDASTWRTYLDMPSSERRSRRRQSVQDEITSRELHDLFQKPVRSQRRRIATLWVPKGSDAPARKHWGIPQPDVNSWKGYLDLPYREMHSRRHLSVQDQITSTRLHELSMKPIITTPRPNTTLWVNKSLVAPAREDWGVPQPDVDTWKRLLGTSGRVVHSKRRELFLDQLTSTKLRSPT